MVATAAIGPLLVDWNRYRPAFEAAARELTGRPVAIRGPIRLRLLPRPSLSAEDVHIANAAGGSQAEMAHIRTINADLSLADLLTGQLVASSLVLVEPDMLVETVAGRPNWDLAGAGGDHLQVTRSILVDGRLRWHGAGGEQVIEAMDAEITADAPAGGLQVDAGGRWRGWPVKAALQLGAPTPSGRRSLGGTVGLQGDALLLRLSGTVDPAQAAPLAAKLHADLRHLSALAGWPAPAKDAPATIESGSLDATVRVGPDSVVLDQVSAALGESRLAGRVALIGGATPAAEIALRSTRFDLDPWLTLPLSADGRAAALAGWRGTLDLGGEAVIWRGGVVRQGRLAGTLDPAGRLDLTQLTAQFPGGADLSVAGSVDLRAGRFAGTVEGGADALSGVLAWLERGPDPGSPLWNRRGVSLTASVTADAQTVQLDQIDLRFDQSRLTGGLVVALHERPAIGANLVVDRLAIGGVPLGGPAPLGWLLGFDANLQARIGTLVLAGVTARDVVADLTLAAGALTIKELTSADLAGASFAMAGVLGRQAWPPSVDVTLDIRAEQGADTMRALGLPATSLPKLGASLSVEGRLDQLAVTGDGGAAGARIRLNGQGDLLGGRGSALLEADHPDAARLIATLAGVPAPAPGAAVPVAAKATLTLGGGGARFDDLAGTLGSDRFTGSIAVPADAPPSLTLSFDQLDLDAVLGRIAVGLPMPDGARSMQLALAAKAVRAAGEAFDAIDLQGKLDHAGLTLDRIGIGWQGATLAGTARLGLGSDLKADLSIAGLPFDRLAAHLPLLGLSGFAIDGTAQLSTSGTTAAALVAGLAGSIELSAQGGTVAGIDLAALGPALATADRDGATAALDRGSSRIATATGQVRLADGIARIEHLEGSGPAGTLAVRGSVDLNVGDADLTVTAHVDGPAGLPEVGLRLTGPPGAMRRTPLVDALAAP